MTSWALPGTTRVPSNIRERQVFLWIGELPEGLAETVGPACRASKQGQALLREGMLPPDLRGDPEQRRRRRRLKSYYSDRLSKKTIYNSNHYNKIPAATAVLDHPFVGGVFYADLDSPARPRGRYIELFRRGPSATGRRAPEPVRGVGTAARPPRNYPRGSRGGAATRPWTIRV